MTSFKWKKKTPRLISTNNGIKLNSSTRDDDNSLQEGNSDDEMTNHNWVENYKKRKLDNKLENSEQNIFRLKNEGIALAENEEYWQAIGRWDEALQIIQSTIPTPPDETKFFHEMKSQAFMQLHEWEPAIESSKSALKIDPNWHSAHQTLGRAYLGKGDVKEGVKAFSRARHICPQDQEIKNDDLEWANSLLTHLKLMAAAKELNENK